MLAPVDLDIRRLIDVLNRDETYDPTEEIEVQPWMEDDEPLDPVARITADVALPETTIPVSTSVGLSETETYDLASNTRKEQRIADETFEGSTKGSPGSFQAAEAKYKQSVKGDLTNEQFVKRMLAKEGMDYEWGGTTKAGGFDCSGIIWRIMTKAGHTAYPRHSSAIYEHSKKISLKKAINTRGAILYTPGHIAISLGNGKTIEAKGEDYGVVKDSAHGRFKYGGLLPELAYMKGGGKRKRAPKRAKSAPSSMRISPGMNKVSSVDSITSADTVFGTVMAEIAEAPQRKGQDQNKENLDTGGLKFVPKKLRPLFAQAADKYGISARLLASIAQHESGFDVDAVSSAGAQGVMQVMPLHGLDNPNNPKANIFKGAEIFASYVNAAKEHHLSKSHNVIRLALAMYNAGPNNTDGVLESRMSIYSDPIIDLWKGK